MADGFGEAPRPERVDDMHREAPVAKRLVRRAVVPPRRLGHHVRHLPLAEPAERRLEAVPVVREGLALALHVNVQPGLAHVDPGECLAVMSFRSWPCG